VVAQVEQAPIDTAGGATNESMDVDKGNEEVEVEAVWEVEEEDSTQAEELDPRTLGVPGLETLVPGDLVEVLWANGALSPRPCPAPQRRPQAPELHHVRAGWERGRVKECVLELRAGRPVILYGITYDDGEKVSSHTLTSTHSRATAQWPAGRTQVAEDLRTIPARKVHEASEEDVQCIQQCGSMLRSTVEWCEVSPQEPTRWVWWGGADSSRRRLSQWPPSQVGTSRAELLRLPTAPHRPCQGRRLQPPCQANPTLRLSPRFRHLTQTDQRQTLHNAGATLPTSLHTLRSTSAALCLAATRTCRASALWCATRACVQRSWRWPPRLSTSGPGYEGTRFDCQPLVNPPPATLGVVQMPLRTSGSGWWPVWTRSPHLRLASAASRGSRAATPALPQPVAVCVWLSSWNQRAWCTARNVRLQKAFPRRIQTFTMWSTSLESGGGAAERSSLSGGWGERRPRLATSPHPCLATRAACYVSHVMRQTYRTMCAARQV